MKRRKQLGQFISLILAGEAIFLLPFVIPRVFRTTLLEVYQISNLDLGYCFSIYGLIAIGSYFFGGPLADLISSRKLMTLALVLTAVGGIVLALFPGYSTLFLVYAFWGFSTIFLFWAALMKSTRLLGAEQQEGRAFGWVEGGRGLSSALFGSLAVILFSFYFDERSLDQDLSRELAYQKVLFGASFAIFGIALINWLLLPRKEPGVKLNQSFKGLAQLLKNKKLALQAIIVLCAYSGYRVTDDLSLYARDVWGFGEEAAVSMSSKALYLRPLMAISAGVLADTIAVKKVLILSFGISSIGALSLALFPGSGYSALALLWLGFSLSGIYALRGIYMSLLRETGISRALSGTAVGIISVVGYLPDVFMSPLMGWILDRNPGPQGHHNLFISLSVFMFLGAIASFYWGKIVLKKTIQ
jgi:MFS family permease